MYVYSICKCTLYILVWTGTTAACKAAYEIDNLMVLHR